MELGFHDVIKGVVLTTKSTEIFKKQGQITFKVHKAANKNVIKNAVEKIWDVKVEKVRVITVPGKQRRFGGKTFKIPNKKKAIITLKKGYSIDLPGQFETTGISSSVAESLEVKEK